MCSRSLHLIFRSSPFALFFPAGRTAAFTSCSFPSAFITMGVCEQAFSYANESRNNISKLYFRKYREYYFIIKQDIILVASLYLYKYSFRNGPVKIRLRHPIFPRWYRFSTFFLFLSLVSVFLETNPSDLTSDHPPDTKS